MSYDDAYDFARDSGLCREAAADYAYDVWRGLASPPHVPEESLRDEYDWRCREAELRSRGRT